MTGTIGIRDADDKVKPVAIVTGAASGIGLAVTKHLLSKGYKVAMADLDANGAVISEKLGTDTIFIKADVADYTEQAALFQQAFLWGENRLDFFHANAGIGDKQSIYEPNEVAKLSDNGLPLPIDMKIMQVDLDAVIQGVWLFRWFARKNEKKGGKILITSSSAGI
jgi:15-hydroxyprostaglandin dehydrogenase (NAD)